MASDHSAAADDTFPNPFICPHRNSSPQPGSQPTPTAAFPQQAHTATSTRFLPGNPPLHLAPSITHQPELLLLSWMFDALFMLVTRILDHPIAEGPIPDPSMLVDDNAYQLFHQFHRSLANLGRDTLRPMRARRLLQFIPGPPGLPGQYRMDPTAYFPPHTTDFLSTAPTTPPQSPARSHRNSRLPPPSPFCTAPLSQRPLTFTRQT